MPRQASATGKSLTARILSAMGVLGSVETLNIFCGVVRTKLAAIWIGSAGIGLLGLFNTVVELIGTVSQLGIRTTAVRHIAAAQKESRGAIVRFVMGYGSWLALGGFALALLLSPLLSIITFGDLSQTFTFMMLSASIGCNTLAATRSAILQATGRLRALAKATAWSAGVALSASIPLLYFFRLNGIVPVILTYSAVNLIMCYVYTRGIPIPAQGPEKTERRTLTATMLRLGAFLSISGASGWLASYVVMSYINATGGENAMGIYQAGYTITMKYVGVVFTALSLEYFPRLTSSLEHGLVRGTVMLRHETLLSVAVVSAVSALLIPFTPLILKLLYNTSFMPAEAMIVFGAPGIVLRAVSWTMGYAILAKGRGKLFLISETASCVVCVAATCLGFKIAGIAGIGVAFTIWYLVYTLMVWIMISRCMNIYPGVSVGVWSAIATIVISALAVAHYGLPLLWSAILSGCITAASLIGLRRLA